jgi:hypothetical protein
LNFNQRTPPRRLTNRGAYSIIGITWKKDRRGKDAAGAFRGGARFWNTGQGACMTISEHRNGAGVVLEVDGRVDANTSEQLQTAVLSALRTANLASVGFDEVLRITYAR